MTALTLLPHCLRAAVFGDCPDSTCNIDVARETGITGDLWIYGDGRIQMFADDRCNALSPEQASALQQAIGNALVLHARLTGCDDA